MPLLRRENRRGNRTCSWRSPSLKPVTRPRHLVSALLVFASTRYSRKAPQTATACASVTDRTKTRLPLGRYQTRQGRLRIRLEPVGIEAEQWWNRTTDTRIFSPLPCSTDSQPHYPANFRKKSRTYFREINPVLIRGHPLNRGTL